MPRTARIERNRIALVVLSIMASTLATSGCQEVETIKREVWKKAQSVVDKKKASFVARDGITVRGCSLYQTANQNAEVLRKLPAETPVHLLDKVGEWYRVRTNDGREGYVETKVVGGREIILKTQELRRSLEGIPVQAEGVTKSKANFRLEPGREPEVIEVLPQDKKLEIYERVVTIRKSAVAGPAKGKPAPPQGSPDEASAGDDITKDVWYKVKIEDGRVGYINTHNLKLTPPDEIARLVPFMRLVAWRTVSSTDDRDRGMKSNYLLAYAPIGKDAGCDYTRLYFWSWAPKTQNHVISWQTRLSGVLPLTNYQFENAPGFSIRFLHPTKKDKLVLASFAFARGTVKKVGEEEINATASLH